MSEQANNAAQAAQEEKFENVTGEQTTQQESPSFGEKAKMYGQAAGSFMKDAVTEKIDAYKENPVKEGFKDIVTMGLLWLAKKGGKALVKSFKNKETKED